PGHRAAACYPVCLTQRGGRGPPAGSLATGPCRSAGESLMTNITLLPGWALDAECLQPLADALQQRLPGVAVATQPLPAIQLSSLETDLSTLAQQIRPGVLVGWSLGGMLAVQLHRRFPEHFPRVVSLASNDC